MTSGEIAGLIVLSGVTLVCLIFLGTVCAISIIREMNNRPQRSNKSDDNAGS